MKLSEWLPVAEQRLRLSGVEASRLEAQLLAAHLFRKDRTWVIAHPEHEIEVFPAENLLQRRESQEPLAYIIGSREFYGRKFHVRPGVLIPRHETEGLVEAVLTQLESGPVLDIGTGSGCIAITLKLERPRLSVTATDISQIALEIAQENAEALGAEIQFKKSDLFKELHGRKFSTIVSNPPYIGRHEKLPEEVAKFEPEEALYAPDNGLAIYRRLAHEAASYLLPEGRIYLEIGHLQAPETEALFQDAGWTLVNKAKDLGGRDRVLAFAVSGNVRLS